MIVNFSGEFILEYVGEVLDSDEFDKRAEVYSQDKNIHYYFMALRADAIIDATMKGTENISHYLFISTLNSLDQINSRFVQLVTCLSFFSPTV